VLSVSNPVSHPCNPLDGHTNSGATETITLAPATGVTQSAYNTVNELTNVNAGGSVTFAGNSNQPLVSASIATSVVSPTVYPSLYSESVSGAGTETISLGQYAAGTQTATIGGTATTGDQLSIEVTNSALAGGEESVSYTVPSGSPSTTTMAAGLASSINADTHLQALGVTATSTAAVVTFGVNPSAYSKSVSGAGTETISLAQPLVGTQTATIGGTPTSGDGLTITVANSALSGGVESATYTVPTGSPTTSVMATGVAAAINNDAHLQRIGVTASSSGAVVTIVGNATFYTTTNGSTEILTVYPNVNGTSAIAVSGTPSTSDVVKITVHNSALSTGSTQISYTVLSTDTLQTIASALVAGINGSSALATLGVTAQNTTAATLPSTLSFAGSSILAAGSNMAAVSATNGDSLTTKNNYQLPVVGTAYSASANVGATETIAFGPNNNGNSTVTVGGSTTTGDQVTLTAYNPSLGAGPESLTYAVLSTDTLTSIAAALTSLINADSKLPSLGVSATSTGAVITIAVSGGAGRAITYDANGNMTFDGTKSYAWDAENRLIQVTYPGTGNNSQFTYDPASGLVKIIETVSGSVTSTKQFVRCGSQMCEERNTSSAITKQFFAWGQTLSGTNYFYTKDGPPGSTRDLTDPSGNVAAHYEYGMYGEVSQTVGTIASDFQYTGLYYHAPSGLNLATYRAYSPSLGRWTSRDPIEEDGGTNLYAYVGNDPVDSTDPSGLKGPNTPAPPTPKYPEGWPPKLPPIPDGPHSPGGYRDCPQQNGRCCQINLDICLKSRDPGCCFKNDFACRYGVSKDHIYHKEIWEKCKKTCPPPKKDDGTLS
jgi:RHS repeat-associated protein